MSFGPSPPFPFLTVGYSLPQAGQNPCTHLSTIRVNAWFPWDTKYANILPSTFVIPLHQTILLHLLQMY